MMGFYFFIQHFFSHSRAKNGDPNKIFIVKSLCERESDLESESGSTYASDEAETSTMRLKNSCVEHDCTLAPELLVSFLIASPRCLVVTALDRSISRNSINTGQTKT